jgi:hypothetical protein
MPAPLNLIQLVSEQTMQNVLPAIALRPARLILLHTPRTAVQCQWIAAALRRTGATFELQLIRLTAMPDIEETGAAVRQAIHAANAAGGDPLVNITGGTKLMSIGAFAATLGPRCPSFYVDTENRRFLDAGQVPAHPALADPWNLLQRAETSLNVDVVCAAHGIEHVTPGRDPLPFIALAEHLRLNPADEAACHAAYSLLNFRFHHAADVIAALDRPAPALPPAVEKLALEAGLLTSVAGTPHFTTPHRSALERWARGERWTDQTEFFTALQPLQFAQAFLSGGWWEVCVAHAAHQSGRFRDLRWSCEVGAPGDRVEEDLLGVDGFNLAVFSCKRGGKGDRLNRAFEEFVASARRLGGSFSGKFFCVAQPIARHSFALVQTGATRERVSLVGPSSRLSPSVFAR